MHYILTIPAFSSLPPAPLILLPPLPTPFISFSLETHRVQCCPYAHCCGATHHWAPFPKKHDPFPSSSLLPSAPHWGEALGALPSLCLSFAPLHLVQVGTSDRALECTYAQKTLFPSTHPVPQLLHALCSCRCPWGLVVDPLPPQQIPLCYASFKPVFLFLCHLHRK